MDSLSQFAKKNYLSLETFRKNGEGVKTPVWFVQEGDVLYVRTGAQSGKVKRIRRSGKINTAPCGMNGKPQGTWVPAQARELRDPAVIEKINQLMKKKYGLMDWLMTGRRRSQTEAFTVLEVKLTA